MDDLELELGNLWQSSSDVRFSWAIRSAGDMYACWPSSGWFRRDSMPILDYLQFESGDSSYNVWIFTLQHALSFLGRLVCDLYLRMNVRPKSKTPCKRRKSETSLAEIFGSKFEFLLPFARR